jgi:acyl-homoserine lactone acylase PvdQ
MAHDTLQNRRTEISNAEMEAALAQLADELGHIPNITDWGEWADSPCHKSNIGKRYDTWTEAIAAAGLPVVAAESSEMIRQIAYERPDLAGSSSEVHD